MKKLALALLLAACTPITPTPPGRADCAAVCAHGSELACAWARPTPNGVSCVQVCEDANTIMPWAQDCMVTAGTCSEADACR